MIGLANDNKFKLTTLPDYFYLVKEFDGRLRPNSKMSNRKSIMDQEVVKKGLDAFALKFDAAGNKAEFVTCLVFDYDNKKES